jgi:hypothetical protein
VLQQHQPPLRQSTATWGPPHMFLPSDSVSHTCIRGMQCKETAGGSSTTLHTAAAGQSVSCRVRWCASPCCPLLSLQCCRVAQLVQPALITCIYYYKSVATRAHGALGLAELLYCCFLQQQQSTAAGSPAAHEHAQLRLICQSIIETTTRRARTPAC